MRKIYMKKELLRLLAGGLLPWLCFACGKDDASSVDGCPVKLVEVGYSLSRAPLASQETTDDFPLGTTFRLVAFVKKEGNTEPSITSHENDPKASPYGYYCYEKVNDNVSFYPCGINPVTYESTGRDPNQGQKLPPGVPAVNNKYPVVAYEILAYSPPRATHVDNGTTLIRYNRGEDLYISDKFTIIIPSSEDDVYKIYPVPDPFLFRNMQSRLTLAFYQDDVPYTLEGDLTAFSLGTSADLHPYDKAMKIYYTEGDGTTPHPSDNFALEEVNGSDTGTGKRLRYTLKDVYIPIFPADYTSATVGHPIEVEITIAYTGISGSDNRETMKLQLPVNAQPSYNYLISFIVSRTKVSVTSHVGNWSEGIPETPLTIGGADGGILLGNWKHTWNNVDLPGGEDL